MDLLSDCLPKRARNMKPLPSHVLYDPASPARPWGKCWRRGKRAKNIVLGIWAETGKKNNNQMFIPRFI